MHIHSITILGQGNVAWHYNRIMLEKGFQTRCISARENFSINDLMCDLIVIAVKDDAIKDVCDKIFLTNNNKQLSNQLLVHTSGYMDSEILSRASAMFGCLYPVQSLKKGIVIDFQDVPLCYWANTKQENQNLKFLADRLSKHCYNITDNQRKSIHLAAVFANNFTNHLLHISKTILERNNIPFDILFAIIEKTFLSVKHSNPFDNQTGPAIRQDFQTIQKHRLSLTENEREIYDVITKDIIRQHT